SKIDSKSGGGCGHDDAIDPKPDQLGGELREALGVAFREPTLEDEVLSFAIPALTQPVQERIPPAGEWGIRRQEADPVDLARRLRRSGERRYEQTQEECDDGPDGAVPHGRPLASASCRPASFPMNEAEHSIIRLGAVKHSTIPYKDRTCPYSTVLRCTRQRMAV